MILNTLRVRYCPVMDTSEGGERGQHEPVPLIGKIGHRKRGRGEHLDHLALDEFDTLATAGPRAWGGAAVGVATGATVAVAAASAFFSLSDAASGACAVTRSSGSDTSESGAAAPSSITWWIVCGSGSPQGEYP